MAYRIKRWKTARGLYYLLIDGGKRTVTSFVNDFLKKVDPGTLKAEEKNLKKRKENKFCFLEGPSITIMVMDNHIFIKPENEEKVLEIIQGMVELPDFSKKKGRLSL